MGIVLLGKHKEFRVSLSTSLPHFINSVAQSSQIITPGAALLLVIIFSMFSVVDVNLILEFQTRLVLWS